jgi:hypothetical protein
MKTYLSLELFDENLAFFYRKILDEHYSPSSWVAEITGFDDKYKFSRKFLPVKKDYCRANKIASEGVFAEYILESLHIYDVKQSITKYRSDRYFCTVTNDGDIKKLSEQEVINWLNNTLELTSLLQQGKE